MYEVIDSTIMQISSSCVEWWYSLSVAYDLTCFMTFFERVWIEDGSSIDRVWNDDGSTMDRGWIDEG